MRGGEKCLEVLCELYPDSPIHTLFYEKGKVSPIIAAHPIQTSFLQNIPGIFRRYRSFLPLYTTAIAQMRPNADLIISSSHCVAKGIPKPEGAKHVCYCFTPMRYAWGFFDDYFGERAALVRSLARWLMPRLRRWDLERSRDVDRFIAISEHVRRRIRDHYGREAALVYPPVDTDFYTPGGEVGEHYLVVSALVPYKRVDIAIAAAARAGRKLIVIGDGPERARLERAAGPDVRFLGWLSNEDLRSHYRQARALLFPGEEDFGIVPVEAQACGRPVIAYRKGGALETVLDGRTGVFFDALDAEALAAAITRLESMTLDPDAARQNAERFSRERFRREIREAIEAPL